MNCRLCGQQRPLIEAHIITRSIYDALKDAMGDSRNAPVLFFTRQGKPHRTRSFTGLYDKGILCAVCDNTFSPWEQHATRVLFTKNRPHNVIVGANNQPMFYTLLGAKYAELKLFFLSVLWKASITTEPTFAKVKLEPSLEDEIKGMLVRKDPGPAGLHAVRIAKFYKVNSPLAMFEPWQVLIDRIRYAVIYLPGYKVLVQVDHQILPPSHDAILQPAGSVLVRLLNFQGSREGASAEAMERKLAIEKGWLTPPATVGEA